jgi:autotransporter-associated beta strand protein
MKLKSNRTAFLERGLQPASTSDCSKTLNRLECRPPAVAAGVLPAVEPGFQPGGFGERRHDACEHFQPSIAFHVFAGRQDAALYGRQGCLPLRGAGFAALLVFLLVFLFVPLTHAAPPVGYYLVWADEFNGSSLDTTRWNYWLAGPRRDAVNVSSAVSVGGGNLTITTYTTNGTHYTGMIATDNKFRTKFGYWEASIDWNDAPGMWSAYWMQSPTMGADISAPVTSGCEIDIQEHRSIDSGGNNIANQVQANIHWNGYGASHQSQGSGNQGSGLNTGFHTYGFKWTSSSYDFTIDGVSKWAGGSSPVSRSTEWMILSSEVEDGSWAGSIPVGGYGNLLTSTTKMAVDYVRYYAPTSTIFWKGTGSAYWTNAANWVSNMTPTSVSDVTFSYLSTANRSNFLGTNITVDSLTVLETTAAFSVNGPHTLTIGAGGVDMISLSSDATFNCPVVISGAPTWTIGNGRKLTVTTNLSGVGGSGVITKAGKGTLVVGVSNAIAKTILATDGFVAVSAGASNQFGFSATGSGGVKAVVGASPGRCAVLNLTNANLDFEFGTVTGVPGAGLIVPTLNLSGTNDVNIAGLDLPVTNITLLTYTTKNGSGSFQLGTLPAGAVATLTDSGSSLVLNVTVWPQVLTWNGSASGAWSTNGALDWDAGAKAYQEYASSADSVVFDDAAADFSVTLSHALKPASVTVDNDLNDYTFSPPGKISGATTFVKRGTNTVTLTTTNNFTGDTTITEGKVVLGANAGLYQKAAGTKLTVKSGGILSLTGNLNYDRGAFGYLAAQASGLVLDDGTLQHTGTSNPKTADGAGRLFTIGAGGATLDSATAGQTFAVGYRYDYSTTLTSSSGGNLQLTGVGHGDLNYGLPGSGGLIKSGTGTWTLSGTNTYTGATTLDAGMLVVSAHIGNSAVSVNNAATLAGNGGLGGAVTVTAGGKISPGVSAIGRLTISNNLTLQSGGTVSIEVNKTSATNDSLLISGTANYGGTLSVTNLGGALAAGDKFKLFTATTFTGDFASVAGSPGANHGWKFLPASGELLVSSITSVNLTTARSNNTLVVSWPADHIGWTLLTQTNSLGTNWTVIASSVTTNVMQFLIAPEIPAMFFKLTYP